jgi:hypothetical protein
MGVKAEVGIGAEGRSRTLPLPPLSLDLEMRSYKVRGKELVAFVCIMIKYNDTFQQSKASPETS